MMRILIKSLLWVAVLLAGALCVHLFTFSLDGNETDLDHQRRFNDGYKIFSLTLPNDLSFCDDRRALTAVSHQARGCGAVPGIAGQGSAAHCALAGPVAPGAFGELVVPSIVRVVLFGLSGAIVAGCASVQVRSVGTNTGSPAYDLSGPDLASLSTEAVRLCPQGHWVMRQWQRSNRPVGASDVGIDWALRTAAFSYELQPDQARMSIACQG